MIAPPAVRDVRADLTAFVKPKLDPKARAWNTRELSKIRLIAVHHEGGVVLPDIYDGYAEVKKDALYHITKNWGTTATPYYAPNIAYHYQIDRMGIIWRCNSIESIIWHANNANPVALAICLHGHFQKQEPTLKQLQSLVKLLNYFTQGISVTGISARSGDVYGHTELKGKVLGLKYLYKLIDLGNYTVCPAALLPYVQEYRATGKIGKVLAANPPLPMDATNVLMNDVSKDDPFYAYVKAMIDSGTMRGYEDGTFRTGQPVTRGELSKVIVGAALNLEKIAKAYKDQGGQ